MSITIAIPLWGEDSCDSRQLSLVPRRRGRGAGGRRNHRHPLRPLPLGLSRTVSVWLRVSAFSSGVWGVWTVWQCGGVWGRRRGHVGCGGVRCTVWLWLALARLRIRGPRALCIVMPMHAHAPSARWSRCLGGPGALLSALFPAVLSRLSLCSVPVFWLALAHMLELELELSQSQSRKLSDALYPVILCDFVEVTLGAPFCALCVMGVWCVGVGVWV